LKKELKELGWFATFALVPPGMIMAAGIYIFGMPMVSVGLGLCVELAIAVLLIRSRAFVTPLSSQATCDDLVALKAELAKNPEAFEQKILATRVDPVLVAQVTDADLPTIAQLIDEGRDPEEVGLMLADGKARRG
jgi:hypothetical protein